MNLRAVSPLICAFFLNTASAEPAASIACVLASRGPATVMVQGVEKSTPLRLEDCRQASVVQGEVAACFLNEHEQKICRAVKIGQNVSEVLAAPGAEGSPSIGTTLVALLRGDASVRTGSSRGGPSLDGMPYGTILLADSSLVMNAGEYLSTSEARLHLFMDAPERPQLLDTAVSQVTISIPSRMFVRGAGYLWQLQGDNETLSGRFSIAGPELSSELSQARAILSDSSLAPIEKDLLLLDIYQEAGCAYERDQVLARLR